MTSRHEHARRLSQIHPEIRLASDVQPGRARCSGKCLRLYEVGELHDGRCQDCTSAENEDRAQSTVRAQLLARDGGRCAICGKNCVELLALREGMGHEAWVRFMKSLDFIDEDLDGSSLWHFDHITPKAANGPTTLENARTLCRPDHRKVSSKFAASRSKWPKKGVRR